MILRHSSVRVYRNLHFSRAIYTTFFTLFLLNGVAFGQQNERFFWLNAAYGTPVITNTNFNTNGLLEIKAGAKIVNNITLVGGLENTLRGTDSIPERFSPYFGPGYVFMDQRIFLSIHTGIGYPFYRNAPEGYTRGPGLHTALDLGIRLASKITAGIGLSNHLAADINAFTLRFWFQINSD